MKSSQKGSEVHENDGKKFTREEMNKVGGRVARSCVLIHVGSKEPRKDGSSSLGRGAGFFVAKNLIVTNTHVVQEGTDLSVHVTARKPGTFIGAPFRQVVKARLLVSDKENDLAVIELIEPRSVPVLKFSQNNEPAHGVDHLLMRNPQVNGSSFSRGTFLKRGPMGEINGPSRQLDVLKFAGKIETGDSGSPVVDRRGDVVGVVASTIGGEMTNAVPLEYVERLVEKARKMQGSRKK